MINLDTWIPQGLWTYYNSLAYPEREAKILAGRLLVFCHGTRVVRVGASFYVLTFNREDKVLS